jgi:hypothetical protein
LLQSAVPPTAAPSSLTASDGAHKRLMRRKNRSESFRSDRIGDGGPEDDDHDEDDYYEDDDANSASSSNTKSTGDSNAASARVTKSAEQAAGREPPFFAILCRLLDTRRPALLVRFCRLLLPLRAPVSATSTTRQVPFYLQQVYEALPPFLHYAFEPYSQMTESEPRMQARVWLLCQINQAPNALRLLLLLDRWDKAIELMRKMTKSQHREEEAEEVEEEGYVESGESERKRKAFEQLELFNVLFMHCIEKRDKEKLKQSWEFMPPTFDAFDLLSLIKSGFSSSGPLHPSYPYSSIFVDGRLTNLEKEQQEASTSQASPDDEQSVNIGGQSGKQGLISLEDFLPYLVQSYHLTKDKTEKQQTLQEQKLAQLQRDIKEREEKQRREELEQLRRQARLIVQPKPRSHSKLSRGEAALATHAKKSTATPDSETKRGEESSGKTPKRKDSEFISIFDVLDK